VSKHFTTRMSKCRNAEMKKTPFGVGFGYWELECRNTSPQECRNAEMPKCEMEKSTQDPSACNPTVLDTWKSDRRATVTLHS
jgi:hypothetical protein